MDAIQRHSWDETGFIAKWRLFRKQRADYQKNVKGSDGITTLQAAEISLASTYLTIAGAAKARFDLCCATGNPLSFVVALPLFVLGGWCATRMVTIFEHGVEWAGSEEALTPEQCDIGARIYRACKRWDSVSRMANAGIANASGHTRAFLLLTGVDATINQSNVAFDAAVAAEIERCVEEARDLGLAKIDSDNGNQGSRVYRQCAQVLKAAHAVNPTRFDDQCWHGDVRVAWQYAPQDQRVKLRAEFPEVLAQV